MKVFHAKSQFICRIDGLPQADLEIKIKKFLIQEEVKCEGSSGMKIVKARMEEGEEKQVFEVLREKVNGEVGEKIYCFNHDWEEVNLEGNSFSLQAALQQNSGEIQNILVVKYNNIESKISEIQDPKSPSTATENLDFSKSLKALTFREESSPGSKWDLLK